MNKRRCIGIAQLRNRGLSLSMKGDNDRPRAIKSPNKKTMGRHHAHMFD